MNKLIFMGRLVADPEFSMGASGTPYCRFRIAVDRSYAKQGEEKQSDFFRITAFGKTAEFINRYFVKGKPILVEGKIQNDNYVDKNGVQQYRDTIIADNVSFLLSDPTRTANGDGNYNSNYRSNNNQSNSRNAAPKQSAPQNAPDVPSDDGEFGDFEEIISDGSLPF